MDEQRQADATDAAADKVPAAIVGVGVCVASFESLIRLFSDVEPGIEAAYLVAVRQEAGLDVGSVLDELARAARLPVKLAEDGEQVRAGQIYVAAPDDMIAIRDGHLRTRPASEPVGHRGTLDTLLISLAEHAHERAVAVILAGLDADGTAGVVATKKFGGLSIAESIDDADGTEQGATSPGAFSDLSIPADRIANEIARYVRNLQPILEAEEQEQQSGAIEAQVTQIATILRNATSHDFHGYKRGTFIRRIQRRMQVVQIDGIDAYVERLRADREEVKHLFQDLLIGVTQFFRDPGEFEALERALPKLFENKDGDDQFRVWVLGCATGEEAYSIAILLREQLAGLDHPPDVQIFATDLDARALNVARAGRYSLSIADHIRPDRLERWFTREGDTWCVSKELREMCIFSPHNITKDAPFSRIDLLSCRNLLIYLNTDLQNRVIPIFHFSLRSDGLLFLGSSENITRHQKLFAPVDRRSRLFRRLETATRIIPDFPLSPRARAGEVPAAAIAPGSFEGRLPASVSRQAGTIAERYAPAYVIVDTHGDVLHFSGRTGRYLEPSAGAASLSLPNLVHRDLRLDVRSALGRAIAEGRRVEVNRLAIRQDDQVFGLNLIVEPLSANDATSLVVVFQDLGPLANGAAVDGDRLGADEHVQRLEAELRITRDRLQTTIEELESTNEELKSSNEEYQSINEELQSANEEMETSKEELQSVNEELQTVNGELGHRVTELGRTNSDLKNLLEATQIATVFLDNDLRVRNFTPAATDVFHLLETDVGRPLDHVVARVDYPELLDDVRRVLKTLVPTERQVSDDATGRHFAARVLPYRSVDNYISGAVVTFTDLTAVHAAQAALRESDALRSIALDGGRMGTWRWDLAEGMIWGDARFQALWGFEATSAGLPLSLFIERMTASGAAEMEAIANRAIHQDEEFDGPLAITSGPTAGHWVRWRGRAKHDTPTVLYGVTFDITEQRRVEEALRESEERFRAFVTASSDSIYRMNADWTEMFYLDGRGFIPDTVAPSEQWMETYIFPEDRAQMRAAIEAAIAGKTTFALEHRVRTVDGGVGWTQSRAVPMLDEDGAIVEWFGTATDVTDRREASDALRDSERRQQVLIGNVPQLVWRGVEGGQWTWASPQWTDYTGQTEPESHGLGWLEMVHPEDREAVRDAWAVAEQAGTIDLEHRIRRAADASYRWFRTRATPTHDEDGAATEWIGTSTDVDETRILRERQEVLVAELQHRVRNMLTVVRSVFAQTVENGADLDDVADHFRGRLDALARTQVIVTRTAEGHADLENLIRDELLSVGVSDGDKLRIGGPDISLPFKAAESIGLAIHELTTNALKYGALKVPNATLDIRWDANLDQGDARRLTLTWHEQGVPAIPAEPTREGFGRELIEEALPYRLGAETKLEFLGGGVRCTISVPLPSGDGARDDLEDGHDRSARR